MEKREELDKDLQPAPKGVFSRIKNFHNTRKAKKLAKIESETLTLEQSKKVEEKLQEVNKEVQSSSSRKKKIRSIVFFIFNIALVAGILIWNILSSDDFMPFDMFKINYLYIFCALVMLVAIILLDVLSIHRMVYRKTLRSRWALSYKSLANLRYYDAITPLSSGGQAFMVAYLTGRDVPGSTALAIPIAKLVFQNIAWLLVTFVCLCMSFTNGMATLVSVTSIIGFCLMFVLVSAILFISLSKSVGKKLVSWALKFLVKIKIIKDYDKHYGKVLSFVEDYQNIMKEYSHAKLDVLYQIVLHVLRFVCLFSIPFFIYCGFKGFEPAKFGEFFMYTALIDLASSFIPLPGGTGMNEITFTFLFKQYLGGATFWALLFWRFCSYYFYLLQGLGVMSYDTVYGNRKWKWVKKKYALQEESQAFKRAQIESFRKARDKRRKKQKKEG